MAFFHINSNFKVCGIDRESTVADKNNGGDANSRRGRDEFYPAHKFDVNIMGCLRFHGRFSRTRRLVLHTRPMHSHTSPINIYCGTNRRYGNQTVTKLWNTNIPSNATISTMSVQHLDLFMEPMKQHKNRKLT